MAEVGIVVAVRVRPFKDEDEGNQSLCIDMVSNFASIRINSNYLDLIFIVQANDN